MEMDHPFKLLAREIGDEGVTRTEGAFAQMVLALGQK